MPNEESEFAISNLSINFFVDENTTMDQVVFFHDGSSADLSGTLTADTLTGFGMTAAGITYGNMETLELLLGTGNEELTVLGTADGTLTMLHGGGGDDTITIEAQGGTDERGLEATLIVFGDTSQDGSRYAGDAETVTPGMGRKLPISETIRSMPPLQSRAGDLRWKK